MKHNSNQSALPENLLAFKGLEYEKWFPLISNVAACSSKYVQGAIANLQK